MRKILLRGQSLFEVLFSVAIASLILVSIVSLVAGSVRNADYSQNNALATRFAEEGSEWIRQYRDASWVEFKNHATNAGSTFCINSLPYPPPAWGLPSSCGSTFIAGTIFTRTLNLTNDPGDTANLVIAAVTVNWTDSQGVHTVRSISKLADWNR